MKRNIALASAVSLLILSCQPPQQVTIDVFRLEGNVMVPEQDQSIKPVQQVLNPFKLLSADAMASTGLIAAPSGIEVRLIRIDDEGRPVSGEPLATSTTDANGHYSMDLPTSKITLPATNLVVEVGNYAAGTYLRNFVTREHLDLTPVSTALVQLVVDRTEPLFSIPISVIHEAHTLSEQGTQSIDYSSTNLADALTNTLSSLKSNNTLALRLNQLLTRVVSGRVLAPNGRVAALGFRLDSFLAPPAEALSGLSAVSSDITVNLSKIDNNGNVLGLPLASTKTRSDGSFSIVLPADADLSSEYIVSVGSGPSMMRAMLSGSAQLDISPLTEITTRLILNNGTILSQPKIPITEYDPQEIIAVLDAVQRATDKTSLGGANTISQFLSVLEPVVKGNETVVNNLSAAGGVPGPAVNAVSPVTAKDTVVLSGTARAGSLVTVEGGTQLVSQALAAGETAFSMTVLLKRNSNHELKVRAVLGTERSLPTVVTIRTDTLNPKINTDKIIARNPNGQSFETIITGSTGAIEDNGKATVIITGPKLGNATRIQTNDSGAFEAHLAADSGDLLNLTVVDEADNQAEAQIVVGGPGPVITSVLQETTISRDAPFADRVITVAGAGFDPVLDKNTVTFISSAGEVSTFPRSVSSDRRTMVIPVPEGLVSELNELPIDVAVRVSVAGIPSNDNRSFSLFPKILALKTVQLNGNGESEYFNHDPERQNSFLTLHRDKKSSIMTIDNNGNVLNRDIAENITHDSIFRDTAIDATGNLLTSNFDALLVGKAHELPGIRPKYRISQYRLQGNGAELEMTERLSESVDLGAVPGAIAFSTSNHKIYIALPGEGKILKVDFTGGIFGRPQTLISGLPGPIRDLELDSEGKFMYVSLGKSLSIFRLTLNAQGDVDLLNSNFSKNMGNGNGHMTIDTDDNIYFSVGTGIERIDEKGKRTSLVPILDGEQPMVGLVYVNGLIYANQLGQPDLFRVSP